MSTRRLLWWENPASIRAQVYLVLVAAGEQGYSRAELLRRLQLEWPDRSTDNALMNLVHGGYVEYRANPRLIKRGSYAVTMRCDRAPLRHLRAAQLLAEVSQRPLSVATLADDFDLSEAEVDRVLAGALSDGLVERFDLGAPHGDGPGYRVNLSGPAQRLPLGAAVTSLPTSYSGPPGGQARPWSGVGIGGAAAVAEFDFNAASGLLSISWAATRLTLPADVTLALVAYLRRLGRLQSAAAAAPANDPPSAAASGAIPVATTNPEKATT